MNSANRERTVKRKLYKEILTDLCQQLRSDRYIDK